MASEAKAEFVMPGGGRGRTSPLPGFGLSLGITILWLSLIVLTPLSAVFVKSMSDGWHTFWAAAFSQRALAAYRLSFGAAALAALVNCIFGLLVAWVLVRYTFPGRRLLGALIDLPFALPTAVAGIALTALYADTGIIGRPALDTAEKGKAILDSLVASFADYLDAPSSALTACQ